MIMGNLLDQSMKVTKPLIFLIKIRIFLKEKTRLTTVRIKENQSIKVLHNTRPIIKSHPFQVLLKMFQEKTTLHRIFKSRINKTLMLHK